MKQPVTSLDLSEKICRYFVGMSQLKEASIIQFQRSPEVIQLE